MPSKELAADKYKVALEKAQAEQTQPILETSTPAEIGRDDTAHSEFSYHQTKVVQASPRHLERGRIINSSLESSETAIFRMLRTQVIHQLEDRDGQTLAVCSARDGAGKTFVSINLALILAKDVNHTVMLVDLDLRRPSIHEYFNLDDGNGLVEVLNGKALLSECLINPGVDRLVLLPNYHAVSNSSELLSSPIMANIATELRSRYKERVIIYDLPPILQVDDCIAFIDHIDALLFVVEDGVTTNDEINDAFDLIGGDKIIGTVLNKTNGNRGKTYGSY